MKKQLENEIIKKVNSLKNVYDNCSVIINKNKGIFIQVEHRQEFGSNELEYFVELNEIYNDVWEPCGNYNLRIKFGEIDNLIIQIDKYLQAHN